MAAELEAVFGVHAMLFTVPATAASTASATGGRPLSSTITCLGGRGCSIAVWPSCGVAAEGTKGVLTAFCPAAVSHWLLWLAALPRLCQRVKCQCTKCLYSKQECVLCKVLQG